MSEQVTRWREIEPLPSINGDIGNLLATVDTVRSAWDEHLKIVSSEEFEATRRRTLRRHAIETGIIERLYDVSWRVTEALVAEGITRQAAAREGDVPEDTLAIINSQLSALEMLVETVRADRPLTLSFVKELHAAITRNQVSSVVWFGVRCVTVTGKNFPTTSSGLTDPGWNAPLRSTSRMRWSG